MVGTPPFYCIVATGQMRLQGQSYSMLLSLSPEDLASLKLGFHVNVSQAYEYYELPNTL